MGAHPVLSVLIALNDQCDLLLKLYAYRYTVTAFAAHPAGRAPRDVHIHSARMERDLGRYPPTFTIQAQGSRFNAQGRRTPVSPAHAEEI